MSQRASAAFLLISLAAALWIRLPLLSWGLPSVTNTLGTFHPDESTNFFVMQNWKPAEYSFPPGKALWWGTVHLYTLAAVLETAHLTGFLQTGNRAFFEQNPHAADRLYKVARAYSIFWGLAALGLGWWIIHALWGWREAALAAILLAITPILIPATVYAKVDALMVFWGLAVMGLSVPILKGDFRFLWASGLAAGLAAATKYSAGVYLVFPLLAALLSKRLTLQTLAILGVSSLGGFFIGCPFVIIDFKSFWSFFSSNLSASKEGGIFGTGYAPWLIEYTRFLLPYALGWPLWLAMAASVVWGLTRKTTDRASFWLTLCFLAIYFVITRPKFQLAMYVLPLLPAGIALIGRFGVFLWDQHRDRIGKTAVGFAGIVLFGYTFIYGMAYTRLFDTPKDARVLASQWIEMHVAKNNTIGIGKSFYWTPPVLRSPTSSYQLTGGTGVDSNLLDEIANLNTQKPDYWVLSDSEMREFLRQPTRYPNQAAAIEQLKTQYAEIGRFETFPRWGPFQWKKRWPPWDWMYPYPTIMIFQRKDPA